MPDEFDFVVFAEEGFRGDSITIKNFGDQNEMDHACFNIHIPFDKTAPNYGESILLRKMLFPLEDSE